MEIEVIICGVILLIAAFVWLGREFIGWWLKINNIVKLMEQQNAINRKILKELESQNTTDKQ